MLVDDTRVWETKKVSSKESITRCEVVDKISRGKSYQQILRWCYRAQLGEQGVHTLTEQSSARKHGCCKLHGLDLDVFIYVFYATRQDKAEAGGTPVLRYTGWEDMREDDTVSLKTQHKRGDSCRNLR